MTLAHILKGVEAPGYLGEPEPPAPGGRPGKETLQHTVLLGLTLTGCPHAGITLTRQRGVRRRKIGQNRTIPAVPCLLLAHPPVPTS